MTASKGDERTIVCYPGDDNPVTFRQLILWLEQCEQDCSDPKLSRNASFVYRQICHLLRRYHIVTGRYTRKERE